MKNILRIILVPAGMAACLSGSVQAATDAACAVSSSAATLSSCPVQEKPYWSSFVLDRASELVYPAHVTVLSGVSSQVINTAGIQAGDGSVLTLKKTLLTPNPVLLLDMGTLTGGQIEVGISGAAAGPGAQLRLSYAESSKYITKWGDTSSASLAVNDDPNPALGLTGDKAKDSRWDIVPINMSRAYTVPGIRGGQRWIRVELEGLIGSVSLDYIRIRSNHYRPAAADYAGRFLSSDTQLNRIWYAGAYTFNVATFSDPYRGGKMIAADGAKRDRMAWLGDMGIQTGTALYTTPRAATVMRDTIDLFACQQSPDGYIPMASQVHYVCPDTLGPPAGPIDLKGQPTLIRYGKAPEYPAWWVIAAAQYFELTGDTASIRRWLPVMRNVMKYLVAHTDSDGLFRTEGLIIPNGNLLENGQASIQWDVFSYAPGKNTHTNAVWYRALSALARVERLAGEGEVTAIQWDRQASGLQAAMLKELWDEKTGAFFLKKCEWWLPLGCDTELNHSQDGNVQAVMAGVIGGQQAERAMNFVHTRLYSPYGTLNGERPSLHLAEIMISPFVSSTQLLADFRQYNAGEAVGLMRRLWGNMISKPPYVTFWEKMSKQGELLGNIVNTANPLQPTSSEGLTSMAHGWSTGPVQALSAYVLGIRPAQPGYSRWVVEPQLADLSWAQGQTYTPQGLLISRWERGVSDSFFRLTVSGPAGSSGEVAVPALGKSRNIAMDGQWIWVGGKAMPGVSARVAGDYILFGKISGTHTFAWSAVL
ncbi:MAG: alpha-L-rhamnosidase C-terminal domain-containing protein [Fluviicoccus sp.]|uniref:alpha-L-rhamnosidase-related protein n=1 Tax=Fluviicoccus sp. TaxID=2003552 RepID=UPI0027244D1F|nr:alpha-L-rhamnosidase C-terminal domain-containing protein [Fluviicoccus sp.]MDO8329608.1 alpha-L-rhamnosidase C-terminal domain-containing protein [Fluviicoccus sp.]